MNKILVLSCILSSAAMSGCACLGIGSSKSASAAAPAAVASAPAAAPKAQAPAKTTSIELDIKFETGKDEIAPLYDHQLQKVADFMRMHPEASANVEGYADVVGTEADNRALSQRRSDAVRKALIGRFGCDANKLSSSGYGERPLTGAGSIAERAEYRRVLATFTGTKA